LPRPGRRRAPDPRWCPLAREAKHTSRVAQADCATLMESRVVVVARNAAGSSAAPRSVACYRSQTSCTTSSASIELAQLAVGDAEEPRASATDRSGVSEAAVPSGAYGLIDWHPSRKAALRTGPAPQSAHRIHIATNISPRSIAAADIEPHVDRGRRRGFASLDPRAGPVAHPN